MAQNVLMAEVAGAMNIKPADPGFCFNGALRGRLIVWSLHQRVRWIHSKKIMKEITCMPDGNFMKHGKTGVQRYETILQISLLFFLFTLEFKTNFNMKDNLSKLKIYI